MCMALALSVQFSCSIHEVKLKVDRLAWFNECLLVFQYYTGERVAPVLTIFIGGNHEASNHLWEL